MYNLSTIYFHDYQREICIIFMNYVYHNITLNEAYMQTLIIYSMKIFYWCICIHNFWLKICSHRHFVKIMI